MILVGRYSSPFVRRVGISLHLLDLPFEQNPISSITAREAVLAFNPLGRVPALVLDDGEILIDSTMILDYLDEMVGPDRALVPPSGPARREVLHLVAFAFGAMEKSLACFIEKKLRPSETQHGPLLDRFGEQALSGLAVIEAAAGGGWLCQGRVTQADVSAIAAFDFLRLIWPERLPESRFPKLETLRQRALALPAFAETRP